MTTVPILLAGGSGRRMHLDRPKAFVEVAGRTLLELALRAIDGMSGEARGEGSLVVVAPPGYEERVRDIAEAFTEPSPGPTAVVTGGETRAESVRRGLEALPDRATHVLCHDVARPFATSLLWGRVRAGLADAEAVIPTVPVVDTLKRVRGGSVLETVPRVDLVHVQTPQGFHRDVLERAHRDALDAAAEATDDAALVERLGSRVMTVEGERLNIKITVREDLVVAQAIADHLRDANEDGSPDA